jgi:hypothetical protein
MNVAVVGGVRLSVLGKVMAGKGEEFVQTISSMKADLAQHFDLLGDPETGDLHELLDTGAYRVLRGALTVPCEESDIVDRSIFLFQTGRNIL